MPINLLSAGGGTTTLTTASSGSNFTLTLPSATATVLTSSSTLTKSQLPAGSIVQVVQGRLTTMFSTTSSSYTNITGLSATITPFSTNSKILVCVTIVASSTDATGSTFQISRNGTAVGSSAGTNGGFITIGNDAYVRPGVIPIAYDFLDTPATTSALTYQIQGLTSNTLVINQPQLPQGYATGRIGVSSVTLYEVAQ
jgi:hypothetical protein